MSERIAKEVRNVEHAFDIEARTAQNDWDEYLDSRQYYQDDNGRVHDDQNGQKFAKNDVLNSESDDAYYNRMQSESETEGPFAGKSLKEIAEMVREARASNDKTLENDARAVFDDKFMAMAEKYDWQGIVENADGTTTDRNAIADQKLAYYESVMDGKVDEAGTTSNAEDDSEAAIGSAIEAASNDTESEEPNEAEYQAEETPSTEADRAELKEKLDAEDNYEPEHRGEYKDELIKPNTESDGADVNEGESLEEFEARQPGKHRKTAHDDLEILPVNKPEAASNDDDLEILPVNQGGSQDEAPLASRWQRYGTPSGVAAELSAHAHVRRERNNGRERSRRSRIAGALGAAALLIGGGLLLMKGHDVRGGHGGGFGFGNFLNDLADKAQDGVDSISNIDVDTDKQSGGSGNTAKAHELFGNGNVEVRSRDGYTQVIDRVLNGHDIHLSSNELYNLHQHLEHAQGDYIDLNGVNDTYTMANGDSGLSRPDGSAHVSEATQKAVVRWLEANGKI